MIHRLHKVINGLYRGSAPSPQDVSWLKEHLNIHKIVSLDQETGDRIDRACKLLHLHHVKVYIDWSKKSLLNFLHHNLKKLLLDNGPTFVHCAEGKDRTGLVIALFKCIYMNITPEDAIHEAKTFGFGVGIPQSVTNLYEKLIRSCHKISDDNNADIVSNERDYKSDNRDSFLDEGRQGSIAPYLDHTRSYPYDITYNSINDQSMTRQNIDQPITEHDFGDEIPQVGVYNNDAGVQGFGPVINPGGFIYD